MPEPPSAVRDAPGAFEFWAMPTGFFFVQTKHYSHFLDAKGSEFAFVNSQGLLLVTFLSLAIA